MSIIFLAGDSTVKQNNITTYPQTGLGQVLYLYLKKEIRIDNHAENGRSTKSFLDEGRMAPIYNDMHEGNFLFIQFGPNDAKVEDPKRYTKPFGEYQENLVKMIHAARNRKANPVLITPLCRCWFKDEWTMKKRIHGDYPKAMIQVAQTENIPYIDLFKKSKELLDSLGLTKAKKLFMNLKPSEFSQYPEGLEDYTHLKAEGAVVFAGLIAEGLKELGGIYEKLVLPSV